MRAGRRDLRVGVVGRGIGFREFFFFFPFLEEEGRRVGEEELCRLSDLDSG